MKLIQESLNFERGQDPKTSLKIGFGKYSNEFGDGVSKALIKLKPYLDKYGFKMDEEDLEPPIKLIFSNDNGDDIRIAQRNTLGDGIHGVRVEFSLRNGLLFFDPTTKFENEQVERMDPEEIFQKHFGNPIKEGLNFERGNFPKKALKIGMTELLQDMEEKFKKYFPGVISRYSYFHQDKKTGDGDVFFAHLLTRSVFWNRTVREFFENDPYFELISYEPLDVNSSGASDDAILKIKFNPNKLKESLNFERGLDPKDSMNIGYKKRITDKVRNLYFDGEWTNENAFDIIHAEEYKDHYILIIKHKGENKLSYIGIYVNDDSRGSETSSQESFEKSLNFTRRAVDKFYSLSLEESLNFEKGHDPIKTLNVGRDRKVKAGDQISVFYNGKNYIVTAVDDEKESKGEVCVRGGDFCREPEFESRTFKRVSIRDKNGEIFTAEAKESWDNEGNTIWPWRIDKWDRPVLESINFERGKDPKEVMGIGNEENRILGKLQGIQRKIGGEIKISSSNSFGPKNKIYTLKDSPKLQRGGKIEIKFYPNTKGYSILRYYLSCDMAYLSGANGSHSGNNQRDVFNYIDSWLKTWHVINESVNFERGMEPKKAMKVGLKSPRKFENIEDFTHYIIAALPLIFGGRIPHDILSSKENGIIPQSYFDKICFWLSDKGFQMPNGNSDWANTENTDPDFIHWPEPIVKELEDQLGEKRWQPY